MQKVVIFVGKLEFCVPTDNFALLCLNLSLFKCLFKYWERHKSKITLKGNSKKISIMTWNGLGTFIRDSLGIFNSLYILNLNTKYIIDINKKSMFF